MGFGSDFHRLSTFSAILFVALLVLSQKSDAFIANRHLQIPSQSQFSFHAVETHSEMVGSNDSIEEALWTLDELEEHVSKAGIVISFTTFGPGYRAVARAKHNETLIMGYVEGFVRPAGEILHLDKMEVFKQMVKRARNEEPSIDFGGVSFAIGLILGYRCLLHGLEKGCNTAEFLAIDDEEFQHKRLVRYYKQFGFKIVKYVGEDVRDIPDRLIWGGCGTLMTEDIQVLLSKFSKKLHLMKRRSKP